MFWSNFSFEAWDVERDEWCRVTDIDVDNNSIGLSNGVVRFWRELNVTKLRTPLIKERVTNIIGGRRREDEI